AAYPVFNIHQFPYKYLFLVIYVANKLSGRRITRTSRIQLTPGASDLLIKGTNTDYTKGFIGYNLIHRTYDTIKFTKKSMNNAFISANDWKNEDKAGYSPN
ncbi:MAG: hypothetical protein DCC88_09570, partial [Spirobacillus cienkowskii]